MNWFAVTAPGLEPVVQRELHELGKEGRQENGGVAFKAPLAEGALLCSSMRTPTKLLLRLAEGHATQLQHIGQLVESVPWRELLAPGTPVQARASSQASRLNRRDMVQRKTERVVQAILRGKQTKPMAGQVLLVRLQENQATLSIDVGGELLHRRGWRLEQAKASLRENWAASLLFMAGWTGDEPLLDPFCGSGTIPIEAARLAGGMPPWTERTFAWQDWVPLRRTKPSAHAAAPLPFPVIGSDHHAPTLDKARRNAERAGAGIRLDLREVSAAGDGAPPSGLVATNPPYGARLGRRVEGVYEQLGGLLAGSLPGWRAIFLAPRDSLARRVGGDVQRLTQFSNGGRRVGVYIVHEREASVPPST